MIPFSDADVDDGYERHCNNLLDRYMDDKAVCKFCKFYNYGICQKADEAISDEEYYDLDDDSYCDLVIREPDDYCDDFEADRE